MRTIRELVKKESREILRDPITLGTAIFLPLVMLFIFGYAISLDVTDISMAVYDQDRSQESDRFLESFTSSGYFLREYDLDSFVEVDQVLDRGKASIVVVIPPEFSRDIQFGRTAQVQMLLDGTFSATALIVSNYAEAVVGRYSTELGRTALASRGIAAPGPIRILPRVWYNPSMKSVNYIVPGLFAVLLMAFPPMLTALAIVREKERGTIQQIFVSPIRPFTFILGKVLPYAAIAFGEMLLILLTGTLWFHVPFKGSAILLINMSLIYVFCTVSIGVFVSTITKTQLAAMLLSLIVTLMPSFLFSGFLFPISTMPYVLQLYTYVFPARYFNDISRDLFLKGVGIEYIRLNMAFLILYTAALLVIASLRFKKKVA
ncbi:MAG: ABC transporter permease [Nitrospiraceae bacterium]|nr:ABC transporter permease [Nitrospiraceae bacterium]